MDSLNYSWYRIKNLCTCYKMYHSLAILFNLLCIYNLSSKIQTWLKCIDFTIMIKELIY